VRRVGSEYQKDEQSLSKAINRKRRTVETLKPSYRFVWRHKPFAHEIDHEPQCGTRRAFGSTRLQNPKLPVFDGELYVLDISEVAFKSRQHVAGITWSMAASVRGVRRPETTSSPCASNRKSITGPALPVDGSRENATPEPEDGRTGN